MRKVRFSSRNMVNKMNIKFTAHNIRLDNKSLVVFLT
jgi:hypothetical protein